MLMFHLISLSCFSSILLLPSPLWGGNGSSLNQFQLELGFVNAVAALYDHAMGFAILDGQCYFVCPLASGVAQGCPLSGTTWAIAMDVLIRAVSVVMPNPNGGNAGARADDLGPYLQRMALMVPLADVFNQAAVLGDLHLNVKKCVIIPLWAKLTDAIRDDVAAFLQGHLPDWVPLKIAAEGLSLGVHVGPVADNDLQWAAAGSKWWQNAVVVGSATAPTDANARLYQTSAITVLGYQAQFFDLPPQPKRKDIHAVHKVLRMPPSTLRLKDVHSLNNWMPGIAPRSMLTYSLGAQWRAAHFTFHLVQPLFQEFFEMAQAACGLPAFVTNKWSPVFWKEPQATAQRLNEMRQGRPAQVPAHRHYDLLRAVVIAHRAVRDAVEAGSKPKPQRAFISARTSHWMKGDFQVTIAERLASWYGVAIVPHDLKLRWTTLKSCLVTLAPSWRWITLRTLAGGWHASSRMHVTPDVDQCRLGCLQQPEPDAIAHYLVCDRLQHPACLPRTFSHASVLERLGLGHHYAEHGELVVDDYPAPRPLVLHAPRGEDPGRERLRLQAPLVRAAGRPRPPQLHEVAR
ncbi:unnamed protein product [Prorocentrum cordatum]|uniref:Reverse transcriptase domain-containing protein n=1 Tax=Prorocentrum cordatum TaxID=2364126 RepID=A0ABN9WB64_9DINO|nr:unnamed protein product [Polarella glacialis]